jgi:hypothetical protein
MLRPLSRPHARRGAVLIVVLAMLVLFAVLGLSFVLYSEAQQSAAKGNKDAESRETRPNPQLAAEGYLGGLIYDVGDTGDDLMNPIRGHSLARSKYGYQAGVAGVLPFDADPLVYEEVPSAGPIIKSPKKPGAVQPFQGLPPRTVPFDFNGILDNRQIVRYTWDPATNTVFDPERYYGPADFRRSPTAALTGTYSGKDYAYTYPDRHDYYLAYQEPATGRILLPSFHRNVFGGLDPANPNWTNGTGKFLTLRPRPTEHPNFPRVPRNADGTYTGDVQNLKYTSGSQRNDSLWMDAGGPVLKWRGKNYKAMVAPLVLDLSARVNLSVAGNLHNPRGDRQSAHASGMGWGPWEVNPAEIVPELGLPAGPLPALATAVQSRYAGPAAPADPYTGAAVSRINDGRSPPSYSRISLKGSGPGAAVNPQYGPITLPAPNGTSPFATYPDAFSFTQGEANAPTPGFSIDLTAQNHSSQFNPLLYARRGSNTPGPSGLGLDALVAAASRFDDPRGRTATYPLPTPLTGGTTLPQANALLTSFSTSQQFAVVSVKTVGGGTTALGPVDVNRKLADYRKNPALPLSPLNIWPTNSAEYKAARRDRQNLARDIFVRLFASYNFGSNAADVQAVVYDPVSGYLLDLPAPGKNVYQYITAFARVAACVVDAVDPDDIQTLFVFNPDPATLPATADPTYDPADHPAHFTGLGTFAAGRAEAGHELHRLRINEAYTCVANDPTDPFPRGVASRPLKRQYWFELVNPTPAEPDVNTGTAARSDRGAARFMYGPDTMVPDPTNPANAVAAVTTAYNVYRLDATEWTHSDNPPVGQANWYDQKHRVRIDKVVQSAAVVKPAGTATGDQLRVAAVDGPLAASDNAPYYLMGPQADFPGGGVKSTLNLTDYAGVPTTPVNALQYDVTPGAPTAADIDTALTVYPSVSLYRLANPYLPEQSNLAQPNYNPFLQCDYFERVPTRDRTTHTSAGGGRTPSNAASVGRFHPYEMPAFSGVLLPETHDQVGGAGVPNTFRAANNPIDNAIGGNGMASFFFPDRQLVCPAELAMTAGPLSIRSSTLGYYRSPNHKTGYFEDYTTSVNLPPGLLATTPPIPGAAVGGRTAGKLNMNTVHDPKTFLALLDPQTVNSFDRTFATTFAQQFLTGAPPPPVPPNTFAPPGWSGRTPGVTPTDTNYEAGTGAASATRDTPMSAKMNYMYDYYFSPTPRPPHSLTADEPARKMWNSVGTTSDSFLLVMTVAFFEVENAGPWSVTNQPRFGAELFDTVLGDLRAQYAGVIDRSCLTLADPTASLTTPGGGVPYQTRLTLDSGAGGTQIEIEAVPPNTALPTGFGTTTPANTCGVLGGGGVWSITRGTRLWVGYGVAPTLGDGEWLTVDAVAAGSRPGTATLTLTAATARTRGGGTLVSNLPFGNPGPQPGVTLGPLQARGLVPYFTRLDR